MSSDIIDVFDAVEKKKATYGLVPFENSTFGTVVESMDCFIKTSVHVRAEIYLTVRDWRHLSFNHIT